MKKAKAVKAKAVKAVDIARALHVSKATVSLALNGRPGVKEATRERILNCRRMMEEGSFRTGSSIRMVAVRQSSNAPVTEQFFRKMLEGMEREIARQGYTMEIRFISGENFSETSRLVQESNRDGTAGILLLATYMEPELLELFRNLKIPCVIYDNDFETIHFDQVLANNRAAVRAAIGYLMENGHKRILYFSCPNANLYNLWKRDQTAEQMISGCRKRGVMLEIVPLGNCEAYLKKLGEVCREERESRKRISAIVSSNVGISACILPIIEKNGIRIPKDISFIGIDPLSEDMFHTKSLTYFDMQDDYRGSFAIRRLIERIEGRAVEIMTTEVAPTLVRGETVKGVIPYD